MAVDQSAADAGLAQNRVLRAVAVVRRASALVVAVARRVAVPALMVAGVVLLSAVMWVLGTGAQWWLQHIDHVKIGGTDGLKGKDLADALDTVRGRAMAFGTGLLAAVAIYYTASNATSARRTAEASQRSAVAAQHSAEIAEQGQRRTHELTEQGQVTDRYTRAIEQLGSEKLEIRIGGVYALERIAWDSARDHPTVMEVLAAFLREHTHDDDAHAPAAPEQLQCDSAALGRLRPDLQAALTAIGRRNRQRDTSHIDLSNANLNSATLTDTDLTDADLGGANLTSANLGGANLTDANLTSAKLCGANLGGANLTSANLGGANLTSAVLIGAKVTDADVIRGNLANAYLGDADLGGADLTDADLGGANLARVVWSERTIWPGENGAAGMRTRSEDLGAGRFQVFDADDQ